MFFKLKPMHSDINLACLQLEISAFRLADIDGNDENMLREVALPS